MRRLGFVLAIGLLGALYLADLTGMGIVGPDEPRYASIGHAMAQTGDWITPRLWGTPWFEKPALLYWMIAAGFTAGLGPELAPRLPVALLSVAFLIFFWWRLRLEWDARVAWYASTILATSAGWLAFSHVAVTDLPLSAFFSGALLLSLPWIARGETRLLPLAAASLGLAALDKGLVPLVLFVPVLACKWRRFGNWFRPAPLAAFTVCAVPWYVFCTVRNGAEFLNVFFVQQQFGRFSSGAMQHVQPWWFYVPAFLLLLFPWFPLLGLVGWDDMRVRVLGWVALFGFVFFSVSVNKLPSYVLPLLPATATLIAVGLSKRKNPGWWMMAPVALTGLLPGLPDVVAASLARGLRTAHFDWLTIGGIVLIAAVLGALLSSKASGNVAFAGAGVIVALGFLWFQVKTFPAIDAAASARPLWLRIHPKCDPGKGRNLAYGLYYYSDARLPECNILDPTGTPGVR